MGNVYFSAPQQGPNDTTPPEGYDEIGGGRTRSEGYCGSGSKIFVVQTI